MSRQEYVTFPTLFLAGRLRNRRAYRLSRWETQRLYEAQAYVRAWVANNS